MSVSTQLRKDLHKNFPKQFELNIGERGFVLLTIISPQFENKTRKERLETVEPLITKVGLTPGILELYTPEEAADENVTIRSDEERLPLSWQDAVAMLSSGKTSLPKKIKHPPIKRVVFYSYKGGVGRTTALIQTAFQLARQGKRVVLVDMDVEAPGLQSLLPPSDKPVDEGLIDYLWERQTCFFDETHQPQIELTNIIYSVKDNQSRRDLFIVPAGKIGQRYIQRLSILSTTHLFSEISDPWYQFEEELWKQYQPDIMLIDARTGLNEWGGLSLLQLAEEAFVVLYPSQQNAEGICFVRSLLKELTGVQAKLVLSPIPVGEAGDFLVKKIKPFLNLIEDEEPISIYYDLNIAVSNQFPVEPALPYYAPLANQLLEISGIEETAEILAKLNRLELIKSLSFPERDISSILDAEFDAIFQKTTDFNRCLDAQTWVIRGHKGTGKSILYTLLTKYRKNAEKRSRNRLNYIDIISGHGGSNEFKLTSASFSIIQQELKKIENDWLSLWCAYAIVQIYRNYPYLKRVLDFLDTKPLLSKLNDSFDKTKYTIWESYHTQKLLELVIDKNLNELCFHAMILLDSTLREKDDKSLWVLYDDLDQDINESQTWQLETLGGLMRLANHPDFGNIRFKIFLREETWQKLVFSKNNYFSDAKTVLLQWGKKDFFGLAYRLTITGSSEFKLLSHRIFPLVDNELDESNEQILRKALSPLWGLRIEGKKNYIADWLYSNLIDLNGNIYPNSLIILLNKAKEVELQQPQGKSAPTDHLLRWNSLTKGLEAASVERFDAIKNEYPELSEFFNNIGTLGSLFSKEKMKDFWQKSTQLQSQFNTFDAFLKRLKDIGVLQDKKYSHKYDYSIANIYIDGFNISTMRQKK
ncbi:MAG: AAA family ATPase [Methylococcaceae bacterium]|nr:AAA family ATPase [Methylococcaceae bacterium]